MHPIQFKTPAAARYLGTTYHRLMDLIRFDKLLPPPPRDTSGHYVWDEANLDRARQLLAAGRRWRERIAQGGTDDATA